MSTQICLWDTMKIRWTANWPSTFQLKSIPIHLTVHTQKHTSCCKPTSVMPCCLAQIMQLIQKRCWTKQSEYARYRDAFQYKTVYSRCSHVFNIEESEDFLQSCGELLPHNIITLFREDLGAQNGFHFTELEVNKLRVKDSHALTRGVYCHKTASAFFATAFYLWIVECCMRIILAGRGPCRLLCWYPRTCLPQVLLLS